MIFRRKLLPVALACFFSAIGLHAAEAVKAELLSDTDTIVPGQPFTVALHFQIPPGRHTYWRDPGDTGLPTTLTWSLPPGFVAGEIRWPTPDRFEVAGLTSYGYENEAWHLVTVTPPEDSRPGQRVTLRARAEWLECDEVCVPGEADLQLDLTVGDTVTPNAHTAAIRAVEQALPAEQIGGGTAFPYALLLAFLGGLILNLMPCVFPVLGVKILSLIELVGGDRRKIIRHGLAYTAGVLVSFWLLAGLLIALRAGGLQLGWGFQLQSPAFVYALTVLLFVFGLNLSGVFEVGAAAVGIGGGNRQSGSFLAGVLAVVVATPCAAPFLAPALGVALTKTAGASLALFTAMALGLALPFLALCIFPGLLRFLPKPGAWMEVLRQLLAFPLYAAAAFLVWVLAAQTTESEFLRCLLSLPVFGAAAWLYGRRQRAGKGLAAGMLILLLTAAGLFLGWPRQEAVEIEWQKWSPELIEKLRAEGKPVYVDFTARWCATCQTNKAAVFGSREVREKFRELGVVPVKADWTNRDPRITAELLRWGKVAVPFNLLYLPGRDEPARLPELLTPQIVLDALKNYNSSF